MAILDQALAYNTLHYHTAFLGRHLRLVLTPFPSSKALTSGSGLQTWSDQRDDPCNWDNTPGSILTDQQQNPHIILTPA